MARNTAFFMHQRAVQIVQQQRAAGPSAPPAPPFSFTDPSFGNGLVSVIIDDGSGGKFVGGTFTSVTCNVTSTTYTTGYERLVHLLPTGEVDSLWSCPVGTSRVFALALDVANDRLFVGGEFTTIGGELRDRLAMVEASSGDVDIGWVCDCSWSVYALALDVANDRLFVGGIFATIGGELNDTLALVEASSGTVDTGWVCDTDLAVNTLALDVANDRLFVGGSFTTIGGELRDDLALVEASSGTVDIGWTCNTTSGQVNTLALDVANDRLFVGGGFSSIGGELRDDLALVEASSGTVNIGWVCNSNAYVNALLSDPTNDALFVGGGFNGATGLDGEQRDRFGTVVASTGDLFVP